MNNVKIIGTHNMITNVKALVDRGLRPSCASFADFAKLAGISEGELA
jgi:hypothetical protein